MKRRTLKLEFEKIVIQNSENINEPGKINIIE
jgi:hypothetical protein